MTPILTITGSDNSGFSGLQKDLCIITEMGGHGMTCATCQVTQSEHSIHRIQYYQEDKVRDQLSNITEYFHPKAVKVGFIGNPESARAVAEEIVACKNIVVAPGFVFSSGEQYLYPPTIQAIMYHLVPMATILILRCKEAEVMLNMEITTDEDMLCAANAFLDMGAQYVLLRGGRTSEGRVTALLAGNDTEQFFSSYYIEGWQHHGVAGALSAAVATRLGLGDDVPTAVSKAHEFVHSRVVYSFSEQENNLRPADIYNQFMSIIADNYREAHEAYLYADKLNVSTRYLALITRQTVNKSPKQVITDYLMEQARQMLRNSRLSVKEVADRLGFTTNPIFCKFFKQHEGKTPTEFRKSV